MRLDAEDRRAIQQAAPRLIIALLLLACLFTFMILLAGTAGLALQMFRLTSGSC